MSDESTLGDPIHADGQRHARLAAAMDATPAAPSATETPDKPTTGTSDRPTSTAVTDTLVASALAAWETARGVDGLSRLEAMRAALAHVAPRIQRYAAILAVQGASRMERARATAMVSAALVPAGAEPTEEIATLIRLIEGEPRG